ncbi:U-box domain-containing protein 32-like isoform X4 [Durio zibethinus]|uniref:RING-type E3 ubiquitin transferase n=1 Tax=Durio zibethinus TaxID=66656 RepID=A0A6P6AIP3_DURZI|nr:U-box domain-containing protein 32-like isoform X4 [Durio zibethinus]
MYILKGENRRRICGEMGSLVEETEGQREYDVAETIFVAVGKNVEKSKTTLFWAVHNFPGKMICLLHVHQPTHEPALTDGKLAHNKLKQHVVEAPQKLERQKMQELLDEYLLILDHAGAQADTVWIEMDSVENGIVEIIARHSVRWLVMGAAADKYYSKKLVEVKSKKAIFVCQKAPVSCHTWFTCKGCLIYTRIGRKDGSNIEIATLSPPLDSSLLTEKLELLLSESVFRVRSIDVEEDTDVMGGKLRPISLCSEHPNLSNNGVVDSYGSIPLLMDKEEGHQGRVNNETDQQLELSIMDDHNLKQKVFAETVKQWKEENDCMEAICKVEILSRVRHPNLITMIGTCPESRSLVFEYLRNGSLEDRLACKNNTPPLPWQTRTRIASEICSALIFLHSNKPCIPHGNLKPSKVLLDANFVSKLSDSGIYRLIPQRESTAISASLCTKSNPKVASVYMDPKYLENGQVTRESDVYSFGMILLRLLTGRPALGILKDVKCAIETENFNMVLDWSAGDWPLEEAQLLAHSALRCCEKQPLNRLDLVSEIWSVLGPMRDLCIESVSSLGAKEPRRIPSHFVCPIFQEVMKDPLIAADGFTYEGDAIRGWLESGHDTSPMTNLKLEHCSLVPNYALHQAIQEWQHAQY